MKSTQITKQCFAIRPKLRNPFCLLLVILYLVTSCPVETLLNNVRIESVIRPATSVSEIRWRRNHDFTVFAVIHSSVGILNPFREIMQPFEEIMQPFRGIILPFRGRTHPFERLCMIQYVVGAQRNQFHRDYIIAPIAEN